MPAIPRTSQSGEYRTIISGTQFRDQKHSIESIVNTICESQIFHELVITDVSED